MTPTLKNVPDAYLDVYQKYSHYFIFTHIIALLLTVCTALSRLYLGKSVALCVLVGAMVVVLYRLFREHKLNHRAAVLKKLSQTRHGVVLKSWNNGYAVLEHCGEYFRFKRLGDCKGPYVFDFRDWTYMEGSSIVWTEKESICL